MVFSWHFLINVPIGMQENNPETSNSESKSNSYIPSESTTEVPHMEGLIKPNRLSASPPRLPVNPLPQRPKIDLQAGRKQRKFSTLDFTKQNIPLRSKARRTSEVSFPFSNSIHPPSSATVSSSDEHNAPAKQNRVIHMRRKNGSIEINDQQKMIFASKVLNSMPLRNSVLFKRHENPIKRVPISARVDYCPILAKLKYDDSGEEDQQIPDLSACLLKEFPELPTKVLGFASSDKYAVFFFETDYYLSTFYSDGLNEEFKTKAVEIAPKTRSHSSIFCIDTNKFGVLGGNISNGLDFWVLKIGETMKWKEIKIFGDFFPTITNHASVSYNVDGKYYIYTFGGKRCNKFSDKLLILTYSKDYCSYRDFKLSDKCPMVRTNHSFTKCGDKIYLFGGLSENQTLLNDLWELDIHINGPSNPIWEYKHCRNYPSPRYSHNAFTRNGCLFIAGGFNEKGFQLNDIWKFDGENWSLYGCFDESEYAYGSNFGLASFSKTFNLLKEKPPIYAFSSKYEILLNRRDEYDQKEYDFSNIVRNEQLKIGHLEGFINQLQANPDQSIIDDCQKLLIADEDLDKFKQKFINETNSIYNEYSKKFCGEVSKPRKYTYDLLERLQTKYNHINNIFQRNKKEKDIELRIVEKQAKMVDDKSEKIKIEPDDQEKLDAVLSKLDQAHKNMFLSYFLTYQQRAYIHNEQIIENLNKKIKKINKKHSLYHKKVYEIYEISKEITNTNKSLKDIEQKSNLWNSKKKEIQDVLNDELKLPEEYENNPEEFIETNRQILEENRATIEEIKKEMEDIVSKKDSIKELYNEIENLKNNFKKDSQNIATIIKEKEPLIKKLLSIINDNGDDDRDKSETSTLSLYSNEIYKSQKSYNDTESSDSQNEDQSSKNVDKAQSNSETQSKGISYSKKENNNNSSETNNEKESSESGESTDSNEGSNSSSSSEEESNSSSESKLSKSIHDENQSRNNSCSNQETQSTINETDSESQKSEEEEEESYLTNKTTSTNIDSESNDETDSSNETNRTQTSETDSSINSSSSRTTDTNNETYESSNSATINTNDEYHTSTTDISSTTTTETFEDTKTKKTRKSKQKKDENESSISSDTDYESSSSYSFPVIESDSDDSSVSTE